MVLSSRVGGLGSTQPAATTEVMDSRAEEAHSNQGVNDIDQHLVDDWGRASDGSNGGRERTTRGV